MNLPEKIKEKTEEESDYTASWNRYSFPFVCVYEKNRREYKMNTVKHLKKKLEEVLKGHYFFHDWSLIPHL